MSLLKKLLFTLLFVVLALIVPGVILLLTVDAVSQFSVFVSVFSIILFGTLGFILVSNISLSMEMKDALEKMKKQNSAIAYKLTGGADEFLKDLNEKTENQVVDEPDEPNVDTSKVNLNPETPLVVEPKKDKVEKSNETVNETPKAVKKVSERDFNDFK